MWWAMWWRSASAVVVAVLVTLGLVACQDPGLTVELPAPVAGLAHPQTVRVGQTLVMSAAPTAVALVTDRPDLSARIARYRFEVSDGSPVYETGAPEWTHTFAQPGSYDILLAVQDDHGQGSTVRSHVDVVADMAAACTGTSDTGCESGLCGGEACLTVACAGAAACPASWLGPAAACTNKRCQRGK